MYNCQPYPDFLNQIYNSDLMKRLMERTKIPISTRVVVPFNFDDPEDVIAYEAAKLRCARQFGRAFVWRADVAEGTATFSFTHFTEAVLFAMSMSAATLRAA